MSDLRQKLKRKLNDDIKTAPVTPELLTELRQWRFARSLVDVFLQGNGRMYYNPDKNKSEAFNMLDRWLLSFQLDYAKNMHPRYPLFPQRLHSKDPVNQKLMDECIEKKFSSDMADARSIFDELDRRLRRFFNDEEAEEVDAEEDSRLEVQFVEDPKTEEAHVVVGDFKSKHCWRVRFLVRNFGLAPAARMLMRYEALGTGSLQWGDPITVHNALHDHMGVRYEGFASPLNSKMIDKSDARFCSLFYDTDAVFGSMGSFFKVDFNKCEGGWTVNPPFIEELMDRVSTKVLNYLRDGGSKNWFFITYPRWTDTPGWIRLSESSLLYEQIELDDGRFQVQDSYGRIFPPRNNLTIFLMAAKEAKLPTKGLTKIKEVFRNRDMECVLDEWQRTCRKVLDKKDEIPQKRIRSAEVNDDTSQAVQPTTVSAKESSKQTEVSDDTSQTTLPNPVPNKAPLPAVRNRQLRRFANAPSEHAPSKLAKVG